MSSYIRLHHPGASIYFRVNLARPGSTLLLDEIDHLRAAVGLTRRARPFAVLAWVVLPDQMRCIWRLPPGDCDYPTRWRQIKTRFSRSLPQKVTTASQLMRRERGIWQRRHWEHHIRSEDDLKAHLDLCREAPVEAGLARHARDWPFSFENLGVAGNSVPAGRRAIVEAVAQRM
jgi:REP-associated tyrosine transposase